MRIHTHTVYHFISVMPFLFSYKCPDMAAWQTQKSLMLLLTVDRHLPVLLLTVTCVCMGGCRLIAYITHSTCLDSPFNWSLCLDGRASKLVRNFIKWNNRGPEEV